MTVRTLCISGVAACAIAAVAAAAGFLLARGAAEAVTYNPTSAAKYCNGLSATFPDTKPGDDLELLGSPGCADPSPVQTNTAYPLTTTYSVSSPDALEASPVFTLQSSDTFVEVDANIPNGTKVGAVVTGVTFSLLNGPCTTSFVLEHVLYDAAASGAPVSPAAEGTFDRFGGLVTDTSPADGFADPTSALITSDISVYQSWLDPDLDYPGGPDGATLPVSPRARYTGATELPTGEWRVVSLLQFNAGDLAAFSSDTDNQPHPLGRVSRAPGEAQASVFVLGDPTETVQAVSPVSDTCAPLGLTTMLLGTTPGSYVRSRTPMTKGTRIIGEYSFSDRDADADGKENRQDSCPVTADTGTDTDADGIDNACDPTPAVNTGGGDHDGDGFSNRQDLCPLIADPGQADSENLGTYAVAASDGGPKRDYIGDACDASDTVANGAFVEDYNFVPKCIGDGVDGDGDGYCVGQDRDDGAAGTGGYSLNGGADQDGTGLRGDFYGANTEQYLGTDPLDDCPATTTANDEAVDAWPADNNDTRTVNLTDVLAFVPVMGTAVPPTSPRLDLVPDKQINVRDMQALRRVFLTTCPLTISPPPTPVNASVSTLAIDTDTTGNDARLTGGVTIDNCGFISLVGGTIDIDVVIPAPGIGAADGISSWQFDLTYDPTVLKVTAQDPMYLLSAVPGAAIANVSAALEDTDGNWRSSVGDFGSPAGAEPAGKDEVGPGVLTRITLEAVGAGQSALTINNLTLSTGTNGVFFVDSVLNAAVSVVSACTPPASSTDIDGDGIEDSIDTLPFTTSTAFSDAHAGDITVGTIDSTGGATVTVTDEPDTDPDPMLRGVRVVVSGSGGPATLTICGLPVTMPLTTNAVHSCGSLWSRVTVGPVTIHMGAMSVAVNANTGVRITETSPGVFTVFNHLASGGTVFFGGLAIPPGTTMYNITDDDGDGWAQAVDYCPTVPTVWQVPLGDGDCDGFTTANEGLIGTSATTACGFTPGGAAQSENWPPDLVESNSINILDALALKPVYGTTVPPTSARYDLSPGSGINILDPLAIRPFFNLSCTP